MDDTSKKVIDRMAGRTYEERKGKMRAAFQMYGRLILREKVKTAEDKQILNELIEEQEAQHKANVDAGLKKMGLEF